MKENNQSYDTRENSITMAHLFFPHVFTNAAIPFFKNYFPEFGFDCIVMTKKNEKGKIKEIEGAYYYYADGLKDELVFLNGLLKKYSFVYIHSIFFSRYEKIFLGFLYPRLIKRIVWITWGYDLYLSKESGIKGSIGYILSLLIRIFFEKRIPFFVGIHPVDLIAYNQIIRGKALLLCAPYRFNLDFDADRFLKDYKGITLSEKMKKGEPFTIQVGHRAVSDLNHIALLKRLSVYKDENINILLPLSYGDMKYAQVVKDYAYSIFGGKAKVLDKMVSLEEYRRLLSNVDMLIIDSKRQIALGNIHSMFYMRKKVCLPSDSLLSVFFKENGVKIYEIDDIGKVPFEQLTADDDLMAERVFIETFEAQNPVHLWEDVFNAVKESFY